MGVCYNDGNEWYGSTRSDLSSTPNYIVSELIQSEFELQSSSFLVMCKSINRLCVLMAYTRDSEFNQTTTTFIQDTLINFIYHFPSSWAITGNCHLTTSTTIITSILQFVGLSVWSNKLNCDNSLIIATVLVLCTFIWEEVVSWSSYHGNLEFGNYFLNKTIVDYLAWFISK